MTKELFEKLVGKTIKSVKTEYNWIKITFVEGDALTLEANGSEGTHLDASITYTETAQFRLD